MPLAVDLTLHKDRGPEAVEAVLTDGPALGEVLVNAARQFGAPLALPHMDLTLEKEFLLQGLLSGHDAVGAFRLKAPPTEEETRALAGALSGPLSRGLEAQVDAVRSVAAEAKDLIPCAMTIGPFSLMTTLLEDPITAAYMAGTGATGEEEPSVALLWKALELSARAVERSLRAQLEAGARLAVVCEPAVNRVYISPRQMRAADNNFDRLVMANLRHYKDILDEFGADLFLHDCGELTDGILAHLVELDPAVLSLGSSEKLWEAAKVVPPTTVLYGNLPSKKFYSDEVISVAGVTQQAQELVDNMAAIGRPFILGTECDVLYVSGAEDQIWAKLNAMGEVTRK